MSHEEQSLIDEFDAPYNRRVKLEKIRHESGMEILRLHIREGRRFTVMDLDEATAQKMGQHLIMWAAVKT